MDCGYYTNTARALRDKRTRGSTEYNSKRKRVSLCNHLPGAFCQYCFRITDGTGTYPPPTTITLPATTLIRCCSACNTLTTGEACPKCGASLVLPPPQAPTPTEADILQQLQELRAEVQQLRSDLKYVLSHVAPVGRKSKKSPSSG